MPSAINEMLSGVGQVSGNLLRTLRFITRLRVNPRHVLDQMAQIGADSLPVALLISVISGCVLSLHAAEKFAMTGANAYVGALVALATVREMGPIFTAMAVGARAGTAMTAEMANMAVTNQVDALTMMRVDPIRYLMVPRVLACVLVMPMVTLLSMLVGILGGMITAWWTTRIHFHMFLDSVWLNLKPYDVEVSMVKSLVFGAILGGITITTGLNTKGGARNVGLSTTQATVWTAITIIIADFFLTWMFFGTTFTE